MGEKLGKKHIAYFIYSRRSGEGTSFTLTYLKIHFITSQRNGIGNLHL